MRVLHTDMQMGPGVRFCGQVPYCSQTVVPMYRCYKITEKRKKMDNPGMTGRAAAAGPQRCSAVAVLRVRLRAPRRFSRSWTSRLRRVRRRSLRVQQCSRLPASYSLPRLSTLCQPTKATRLRSCAAHFLDQLPVPHRPRERRRRRRRRRVSFASAGARRARCSIRYQTLCLTALCSFVASSLRQACRFLAFATSMVLRYGEGGRGGVRVYSLPGPRGRE